MRGIADERDTPERPCRQGIAIHQRKLVNVRTLLDQCRQIEPWKSPPAKCRTDFVGRDPPIPILPRRRVSRHRHLANPVGQQLPRLRRQSDGVHNDALLEVSRDNHRPAAEERLRIDGCAPQELPRETRLSLIWIELASNRRVNPISPDQDVSGVRYGGSAVAIAKIGDNSVSILGEGYESQSGAKILSADPLASRVQQQKLQLSAMDRILRPFVSGAESPLFGADQLAKLIEIAQLVRGDTQSIECIAEAQFGELANSGRLQVDANAERNELVYGFVDPDGNSGLMEAERHAQPRNTASNDDHLHTGGPDCCYFVAGRMSP